MKERLEVRLATLRTEFSKGQSMLQDVERQRAELGETLVRISGAIQVLEELLGQSDEELAAAEASNGAAAPAA
jgi:chromosome segregation ATPase